MILVEKNDDLTRKLGVFMGDPAPGGEDDEPKEIRSKDDIIIDDTNSDPDGSDDDYEDELEQISWSLPPINISR